MADHQKSITEQIAAEPDKAKRAELIDNENARLLANSDDILPRWIISHSAEVFELTGSLNFNEWTREQKKIILDRVHASELNNGVRTFIESNFHAAEVYLLKHALEKKASINETVLLATVLYFFMTTDAAPWECNNLTDKHRKKINDIFSRVDKFYTEHKGEYQDAYQIIFALHEAEIPAYLVMAQAVATNKLRLTASRNIVLDCDGNATIEEKGFKAFMRDYSKLKCGLSTGAKKLLDAGAIQLAKQNHFRAKQDASIKTAISISLEKYGEMRGYDITPRMTSTPEEADAEKKRLFNTMCDIRKKANAELALLYSLSLSWTEPGKKKNADYKDVRVLQSKGIRNGYISMRFSEDMATYLMHAYLMQYPTALQALDERSPRTYNIGYKLALHHSIDNNRTNGTANIISVKALLEACGDMPTYEEVQAKNRGHWDRLIKDPLEKALDSNLASGVITNWEYSNSKGAPLNEDQISIPDYHTFTGLFIHFEMAIEPDQRERLQRKAERIEDAKAKSHRKRSTSKKKVTGADE